MRKILNHLLISVFVLQLSSCKTDDIYENQTSSRELQQKNDEIITGQDGEEQECSVIFNFSSPSPSDSEKWNTRNFYTNNYFTILGYETIDNNTEKWFVLCSDYEDWANSIGEDPNTVICTDLGCSGPVCIQTDASCDPDDSGTSTGPSGPILPGGGPITPQDDPKN